MSPPHSIFASVPGFRVACVPVAASLAHIMQPIREPTQLHSNSISSAHTNVGSPLKMHQPLCRTQAMQPVSPVLNQSSYTRSHANASMPPTSPLGKQAAAEVAAIVRTLHQVSQLSMQCKL